MHPLEPGDQRREAVADQNSENDGNQDHLGILQDQDHREDRDDSQRDASDVYGGPNDDRFRCLPGRWRGHDLG